MICISVTPVSRKFAKVDLLNASRQCDVIELCLDHLAKEPDIKDMLDGIEKPILISCRREEEGGQWGGDEDQRLMLLRSAIVEAPAYIELDLATAEKVPRFGDTKRVVSYTRTDQPLSEKEIERIFKDAEMVKADVMKFTCPTPTLEDAWPLLHAITKKRKIPIVGMASGRAGITFSLLGRKYGSPWLYAALEKGMEAYDGQATVGELDDVYAWREIDAKTRFIGIVGMDETETTTVRVFNKAVQQADVNARCLPLMSRKTDKLKQMLDALKINACITSVEMGARMIPMADHLEESVRLSQYADLLLKQQDGWHAYNSIWRSVLVALENALGKSSPEERPLDRRNVFVLGSGGLAGAMVYGIAKRKGLVSIASNNDDESQQLAAQFSVRFVPNHNIYDTLADVVVLADPDLKMGAMHGEFNPSYLRPPMTVIDASTMPHDSPLIKEARDRGCKVVEPTDVYVNHISTQFKSITGQELSLTAFQEALTS